MAPAGGVDQLQIEVVLKQTVPGAGWNVNRPGWIIPGQRYTELVVFKICGLDFNIIFDIAPTDRPGCKM